MSFFSELKALAKDCAQEIKGCAQEINGIVKEAKDEFDSDPAKYTVDSVKEIGAAAGKVAITIGKTAIQELINLGESAKKYREEMTEKNDEYLLKTVKKNIKGSLDSRTKASAALFELKNRGYDMEQIMGLINK